jgi:Icc-related predicted phosphoesterase
MARHRTHHAWDQIPNDIDILVTHGPPLSILDLTLNKEYDQAGCRSLRTKVFDLANKSLRLHCFGHIHNSTDVYNAGYFRMTNITFSNASAVEDRTMNLVNHGSLFTA